MAFKEKFGFGCMRLPLTDEKDPATINQELFNHQRHSHHRKQLPKVIAYICG